MRLEKRAARRVAKPPAPVAAKPVAKPPAAVDAKPVAKPAAAGQPAARPPPAYRVPAHVVLDVSIGVPANSLEATAARIQTPVSDER